jgi:hypothetical protein
MIFRRESDQCRDKIGYRSSASTVNTKGRLTNPGTSNLCCDGSMAGTQLGAAPRASVIFTVGGGTLQIRKKTLTALAG